MGQYFFLPLLSELHRLRLAALDGVAVAAGVAFTYVGFAAQRDAISLHTKNQSC